MEILTAAYFAYLAAMAVARRKVRPAVLSMAALVCLFTVGMPHIMPLVYLLAGYWLPALLVREPNTGFEQRLLDVDRTLFGPHGLERFEQRAPRALIEYLELAYLLCYAVVPAGFVCLLLAGYPADALDTFWLVVLLAAFGCYGVLPWLPTRAPRAIEPPATRDALVDQKIESGGVESRQRAVEHVPKRPYGGVIGNGARGGHSYAPRGCCAGDRCREHRRRQHRRPLSLCG